MKRQFARLIAMILCLAIVCSVPAHAVESRASERIYSSAATLSQKSNGDLSVYFTVQATGVMDVIGASRVEIQRDTVFGWITEYTFLPDDEPTMQKEDSVRYSTTLTYSPLFTGKDYRAVVTIYVENASGTSTKTLTSKTVTA